MVIPTILEASYEEIVSKLHSLEDVAPLIQIDVSDGLLLDELTFMNVYRFGELTLKTDIELHLMVANPIPYLEKKISNVKRICAQVEAKQYIARFIKQSKDLGYKVGLSVNHETPTTELETYMHDIDFVQFMTTKPGKQGGSFFIEESLQKIYDFRKKFPMIQIQTDGAITKENLEQVLQCGVNNVVIGSAIFAAKNPVGSYKTLSSLVEKYKQLPMKEPISSISTINDTFSITSLTSLKRKIKKVCFLGGAAWKESDVPYKDAFEVAKILAQNGYEIVNGGGPGVMRAATQGAKAGQGRALAITYIPNKPKKHYEGRDLLNQSDEEIITLDYFDRTKVMLQNTDVHIVFKGSLGTLSEFGMTWISSWIHEPNNKPIILYGSFWKEFIESFTKLMLAEKEELALLKICTTPKEVLDYVLSLG